MLSPRNKRLLRRGTCAENWDAIDVLNAPKYDRQVYCLHIILEFRGVKNAKS